MKIYPPWDKVYIYEPIEVEVMGYLEYEASKKLELNALEVRAATGASAFYSLIMAAMRQADTSNKRALKDAFPSVYRELSARYNAPGGKLPEDKCSHCSTRTR